MTAAAIQLDLCQWLRDMGMRQDGWPQMVHLIAADGDYWGEAYYRHPPAEQWGDWLAAPPLLSPDPEHPEYGALGFVETLGVQITYEGSNCLPQPWHAHKSESLGFCVYTSDPISLLAAIRDRMQAAEVSAEGAGT